MAVSLGGGSVLLIGGEAQKTVEEWKSAGRGDDLPRRTQGLVQLRVISLDDDVDTQETSCYVHEGTYARYLRKRYRKDEKYCRSRRFFYRYVSDVTFKSSLFVIYLLIPVSLPIEINFNLVYLLFFIFFLRTRK